MRRIFITSLGTGDYRPCTYRWAGPTPAAAASAEPTPFVQRAIVEIFGQPAFDRVIVLVTKESCEKHGAALVADLGRLVPPDSIALRHISSDVADFRQQWRWFEALLAEVGVGDRLVIDMTHGFRAVPIVLSSALGYLQKVKRVHVEHVLYGAHDRDGALVDMRDLYVVQEWAEAVGRLVDSADAGKLAELAATAPPGSTFARLGDPAVARAFKQLTDVLRNVDVHNVGEATRRAIEVVQAKQSASDVNDAERQLLEMVADKFATLLAEGPDDGRYSVAYLQVQLAAARALLEHGLLMQGYTVMREAVGSIGMLGLVGGDHDAKRDTSDGRKQRTHADVFVNMLQFDEAKWTFGAHREKAERLRPWYEQLRTGALDPLRGVVKEMLGVRNGFDHGWTVKRYPGVAHAAGDPTEALRGTGIRILGVLEQVVATLPTPGDASVGGASAG